MKYFFKLIAILFFLNTFIYAEITIVYAKTQQYVGKPQPEQQIEIDKITTIANKENINVKFKAHPWKRALLMLEKGLVDGVINASYKDNRAKYSVYPMKDGKSDYTKRLNDGNSYYVYRNKNSDLHWDGKNFSQVGTVGVMSSYAVIEDLKKHPKIIIREFIKNTKLLRKLASGDLDAYAGTSRVVDELLKKYPALAKNIVRESLPIRKKEYYLIFSKIRYKHKTDEMEKIWQGLQKFNKK